MGETQGCEDSVRTLVQNLEADFIRLTDENELLRNKNRQKRLLICQLTQVNKDLEYEIREVKLQNESLKRQVLLVVDNKDEAEKTRNSRDEIVDELFKSTMAKFKSLKEENTKIRNKFVCLASENNLKKEVVEGAEQKIEDLLEIIAMYEHQIQCFINVFRSCCPEVRQQFEECQKMFDTKSTCSINNAICDRLSRSSSKSDVGSDVSNVAQCSRTKCSNNNNSSRRPSKRKSVTPELSSKPLELSRAIKMEPAESCNNTQCAIVARPTQPSCKSSCQRAALPVPEDLKNVSVSCNNTQCGVVARPTQPSCKSSCQRAALAVPDDLKTISLMDLANDNPRKVTIKDEEEVRVFKQSQALCNSCPKASTGSLKGILKNSKTETPKVCCPTQIKKEKLDTEIDLKEKTAVCNKSSVCNKSITKDDKTNDLNRSIKREDKANDLNRSIKRDDKTSNLNRSIKREDKTNNLNRSIRRERSVSREKSLNKSVKQSDGMDDKGAPETSGWLSRFKTKSKSPNKPSNTRKSRIRTSTPYETGRQRYRKTPSETSSGSSEEEFVSIDNEDLMLDEEDADLTKSVLDKTMNFLSCVRDFIPWG